MKVLAKKPGAPWYEREIDNSLGSLQAFVQGYIETVTLFSSPFNGAEVANKYLVEERK